MASLQRVVELLKRKYIEEEKQGIRGLSHNWRHMEGVAKAAKEYVEKVGLREQGPLAYFIGYFHDFVRRPEEKEGLNNDLITAGILWKLGGRALEENVERAVRPLMEENREIMDAIREAFSPEELALAGDVILWNGNSVRKIVGIAKQEGGEKGQLLLALMYGDKVVEGLGPTVYSRRFPYIGERMAYGDLTFLEKSERDWVRALGAESIIRKYWRKHIADYPGKGPFEIVEELVREEEVVYRAVVAAGGGEEKVWAWAKEVGFPRTQQEEVVKTVEERMKRITPTEEDRRAWEELKKGYGLALWVWGERERALALLKGWKRPSQRPLERMWARALEMVGLTPE